MNCQTGTDCEARAADKDGTAMFMAASLPLWVSGT